MKHIRLEKLAGVRYTPYTPKRYAVTSDGREVGSIEQTVCLSRWRVLDPYCQEVGRHSTIKAAARTAERALVHNAPIPASWVLVPCPRCDGEGAVEVEAVGGFFDMKQEAWYPFPQMMTCPRCNGACEVEVTFEPVELRRAA